MGLEHILPRGVLLVPIAGSIARGRATGGCLRWGVLGHRWKGECVDRLTDRMIKPSLSRRLRWARRHKVKPGRVFASLVRQTVGHVLGDPRPNRLPPLRVDGRFQREHRAPARRLRCVPVRGRRCEGVAPRSPFIQDDRRISATVEVQYDHVDRCDVRVRPLGTDWVRRRRKRGPVPLVSHGSLAKKLDKLRPAGLVRDGRIVLRGSER